MNIRIVPALVLSLAFCGAIVLAHPHHHQAEEVEATLARLMDSALVTLDEAVGIALAAHPGHAVDAELEAEYVAGELVGTYEVEIAGADNAIYEITLDSRDGRMLEELTDYEDEEEAEHEELHAVLRAAKLDLSACIARAEAEGKGRAVEAELEMDDGIPVCEVTTFTGEKLYEIELDMRSGEVIEIEPQDFDQDVDRDDDDADEDEDDEHDDDDHEHGRHHHHDHD